MKKFKNGNRIKFIKTILSGIIVILCICILSFYHKADTKTEDVLIGIIGGGSFFIFGHGIINHLKDKGGDHD